jgi:hypothetical protein
MDDPVNHQDERRNYIKLKSTPIGVKDTLRYYFNTSYMLPYSDTFKAGALWDRNKMVVNNASKRIELLTPVGQLVDSPDLYQICMDRAVELYSLVENTDKKIHVFWSGGLDSTVVLLSLREVVPANKIVILYTQDSLTEYPHFFEKNIQGVYETFEFTMSSVWKAVNYAIENGIAVSGEIGDQLFGSVSFEDKTKETLMSNWQDFAPELADIEGYQNLVAACPQKLTSTAEFLWWANYSLKYQLVQCRMLLSTTDSILNVNLFHFFDNKGFNDYTVSTPMGLKMPNYDYAAYKQPFRDLIVRLSGDEHYAYNKPKVRSLQPKYGRFSIRRVAKAIDTNWKRYYKA